MAIKNYEKSVTYIPGKNSFDCGVFLCNSEKSKKHKILFDYCQQVSECLSVTSEATWRRRACSQNTASATEQLAIAECCVVFQLTQTHNPHSAEYL